MRGRLWRREHSMDALIRALPFGGLLLVGAILGALLLIHFPSTKLFFSWCFRSVGRTAKWFRRKSIETELEGTMNSFSRSLNRDFAFTILPDCEVQWVTAANQVKVLQPGKAIIKLSFSGEDHDLNFYNAAHAF